jgi:hypothetical protein
MALPQYNSWENLTTNDGNQTGRWKAFMHTDSTAKAVQIVSTFNGEGLTFEGVAANTIIPCAFNTLGATGTTVTNGKLFGLN